MANGRQNLLLSTLALIAGATIACSTSPASKSAAPAGTTQVATEADSTGVTGTPTGSTGSTGSTGTDAGVVSSGLSTASTTSTLVATGIATGIVMGSGNGVTSVLSGSGLTVIRDIVLGSAEGSHTQTLTCPTGYQLVAAMADCGFGTCNGNQGICIATVELAAALPTEQLLVGLSLSPSNAHVTGGAACPAGWTSFGSTSDCGNGVCNGSQSFCKQTISASAVAATTLMVSGISLSAEGVHQVGPACPTGQIQIGNLADCGYGVCNGNQTFCYSAQTP